MAMATKCIEGDGKHKLEKKNYKRSYTCYGCEEQGFGVRYRCDQCSYEFHEACVRTDSCKQSLSEMFRDREFSFKVTPPERPGQTLCCNACGNVVKGFVFYSEKSSSDVVCLHPCCTKLKRSQDFKNLKFVLMNKVEGKCDLCGNIKPFGGKINGWSYKSVCGTKTYHVHVSCVTRKALAKENKNIYMNNSVTNRTSLALTNPRRPRNSGAGTDIAKEVLIYFAEIILGTVLGDPTSIFASLAISFLMK